MGTVIVVEAEEGADAPLRAKKPAALVAAPLIIALFDDA